MKLHVYTICWNERRMLPYFFRHYGQFAERIVVYDNGSDDGSQELIAAQSAAELRHFDSVGESREDLEIEVKNQVWKESRGKADWAVVCDVDELLFHRDLPGYLDGCRERGITLPVPAGYQMVAEKFPTTAGQIYDEVERGFPEAMESKPVVFDPQAIEEIQYGPGAHAASPTGRVVGEADAEWKLLHFKFLGWDYLRERYAELAARKSRYDRERDFGRQYFLSEAELAARWEADCARAEVLEGLRNRKRIAGVL